MNEMNLLNIEMINMIVIHCSATQTDRIFSEREMQEIHGKRGIDGIGYHFYIRQNGDIKLTRPLDHKGMHAKGYDDQSIGICYEGGLDEQGKPCDTRTCWQKHSLKVLIKALLMDYPTCKIVGHRDIMEDAAELQDEYCLRECPCFEVSEEF